MARNTPETAPEPHSVPLWAQAALFGLGYFACALIGNALTLRPGPFVTFWLPSGLFVAVLLLQESRHWPVFVLAAFLANLGFDLYNGQAAPISLLFFTGNGLEALAGAWLVRRFVRATPAMDNLRDVAGLALLSAGGSTMLSATVGALVVTFLLGGGAFGRTWLLWWSGDAVGVLLVAPLILASREAFGLPARWRWGKRQAEALLFLGLVCGGAVYTFTFTGHSGISVVYLMLPLVVLGAFRFGHRGAASASLAIGAIGAWLTVHGHSHLSQVGAPQRDQAIALQLFLAVMAFCGLIPATLLAERKRAEEGMREAHQFNEQIIKSAQEGIIVYGPDLRYRVWNPFMEHLTGIPASQVLGRHPLEVYPPLKESGVLARLERALLGEKGSPIDFPFHIPGGRGQGWASDTSAPLRGPDGGVIGVIGTVSDITERKRAEDAVRDSNALLSLFIQHSPIYTYIKEIDSGVSRVLQASENFERMIGIPGSRMAGRTMAELYPQAMAEKFTADDLAVVRAGKVLELEEEFQGRSYLTLKFPIVQGARTLLAGFTLDITERKQAEDALKALSDRLSLAVQAGGVGIWDWDVASNRLVWDEQMYRLHGTTASRFSGAYEAWTAGLHPDDVERGNAEIRLALRDGKPFDSVFRVVWPNGEIHTIRALAIVQRGPGGEPLRMIGTNWDITASVQAEEEKARLQAQLQQSQKLDSLGSLAGGVAHDMNNVLGAILGLASASIEAQPPESQARKAFATIIKASERGAKMVQGLLSFARHTTAEEKELALNEVLQEEVRLLEHTTLSKVRIVLDLAEDLRPIRGDASALTHAFMNICINAVDAMPGGGVLTLRTRNAGNGWVEVAVEDTGTGMAPDILDKALDPYFTTKEHGKGTGLGLSRVYSTVKAHRGRMEIQSTPGEGTRVILGFPACLPTPPRSGPAEAVAPDAHPAGFRVLVVDDDELIQTTLGMLLEALGHEAVAVESGEEALAKLETGFQPDLVILDMNMPGIGGSGTLPRLRGLRPALPVLLATGRADEATVDLVAATPGVSLLSKPFSMNDLRTQIASITAR